MEDKKVVLVNKSVGRNTINFLGAFPINKWAKPEGKVYLTQAEWEWVENSIPDTLGVSWVKEGEEPEKVHPTKDKPKVDAELFEMHHKTAQKIISEMDLREVEAHIDHADENNIQGAAVNELIKRFNSLDPEKEKEEGNEDE